MDSIDINSLVGKTITSAEYKENDDVIFLTFSDGSRVAFYTDGDAINTIEGHWLTIDDDPRY